MELRNIEEVTIERIIVQVLDKNADTPLLTDTELELEPAITAFLTHHILKSLGNDKNRKLKMFNPTGIVYSSVKSLYEEGDFVEISKKITEWLFKCMSEHPLIPSGDLVICQFSTGGERCLAVMKMDYQASFVHDIEYDEAGFKVGLVAQEINLPSMSQRLNKAAFFKMPGVDDYDVVIIDNPLKAEDGSHIEYFQKTFIQGSYILDHMDMTRVTKDQFEKWLRNHIKDDVRNAIELRKVLENEFLNSGTIQLTELAEEIIDDTIKREKFIEGMEHKGLDTEEAFAIDKKYVAKKFKSKGMKTDTGITIKGPFESFHDNAKIELQYNGDNSVNIIIKNVKNISATS